MLSLLKTTLCNMLMTERLLNIDSQTGESLVALFGHLSETWVRLSLGEKSIQNRQDYLSQALLLDNDSSVAYNHLALLHLDNHSLAAMFLKHSIAVSPEDNAATLILSLVNLLQHNKQSDSALSETHLAQMIEYLGFSQE